MVRLIIVLLLSCVGLCVQAEQHIDAYRIDTMVANQSESERIAAAKTGLGDLIVKMTGDATSLQHPLVRQAIDNAPDYLQQFSYSADRDKNPSDSIKLTLNYSQQAIEALLRQAQLSVWPANGIKGSQAFVIRIENVKNFNAFKQVQSYLKTVTMIRRSELLSVNKDVLVFNVMLEGDATLLKSTLDADKKLQLNEAVIEGVQSPSNQLTFVWQH